MKKKLLALFVSMSSVSAMAWQVGDFQDTFDIRGSITRESLSNKWEWKLGESLVFNSNWNNLTKGNKELILNVDAPKGILYGKTNQAIKSPYPGGGAYPSISFADYDNQSITLQQESSDARGTGSLSFPIKDDSNQRIGMLKINVMAAGVAIGKNVDSNEIRIASLGATSDGQHALYGGLFQKSVEGGYYGANPVIKKFKGVDGDRLGSQIRSYFSGTNLSGYRDTSGTLNMDFGEAARGRGFVDGVASASYVLGINEGPNVKATFDSAITSTTNWSAPLKITVTHK